jgi:hypothetical protein
MAATGLDDPRTLALLQASLGMLEASGPQLRPTSLGQVLARGGSAGISAYQGQKDRLAKEQEQELLRQVQQMKIDELLKAQRAEQQRKDILARFYQSPVQQALAPGGGPTPENAARIPQMPGGMDFRGAQNAMLGGGDLEGAAKLNPFIPKREPYTLAPGATRMGPDDKPIFTAPSAPKEEAQLPLTRLIAERDKYPQGHPLREIYQRKIDLETTRQPQVQVNLNTGQKGFDNVLKLRGEFRSEPIYKAFTETESAYRQIKVGLSKGSPAGDLAAATKFMKIIDPGSVVRESELLMAMEATGKLDRFRNYMSMWLSGEKLTPEQRKDFGEMADALYGEAKKMYEAKRAEYSGLAKSIGLNVEQVIGAQPQTETDIDAIVKRVLSGGQ